jgi:hypothetical protein
VASVEQSVVPAHCAIGVHAEHWLFASSGKNPALQSVHVRPVVASVVHSVVPAHSVSGVHAVMPDTVNATLSHATAQVPLKPSTSPRAPRPVTVVAVSSVTVQPAAAHSAALCAGHVFSVQVAAAPLAAIGGEPNGPSLVLPAAHGSQLSPSQT